jgi:outer membrane protein assembly factor BamB
MAEQPLFTLTYDGALYRVGANTGKIQWQTRLPQVATKFSSDQRYLYYPTPEGTLVFVDPRTGKIVKEHLLGASKHNSKATFTGSNSPRAPAVTDSDIYVCTPETLFQVHIEDGTEEFSTRWSVKLPSSACGRPSTLNGTIYVPSKQGSIYALDTDDGELTASEDLSSAQPHPALRVHNGSLYAISGQAVLELSPDTLRPKWKQESMNSHEYSFAFSPSHIYGIFGTDLTSINLKTGEIVLEESHPIFTASNSLSCNENTLYTINTDTSTLYALDGESGDQKWMYELSSSRPHLSTLPVCEEKLYVIDSKKSLVGLDAESGGQLWSVQQNGVWETTFPTKIVAVSVNK